jgi:YfiR/HmsC-like
MRLCTGDNGKLHHKITARRTAANTPRSACPIRTRQPSRVSALLALALIPFIGTARAAQDSPSEYQLKAAFVYNFAKFVDWPPKVYSGPQSPFSICILGTDPFGSVIDDTLRGKTVADHPVVVRRDKDATAARHCQIVFVSASERHRLPDVFAGLKGGNALIVGDVDGFAAAGGAIELTLQDSRVRFAINPGAADGAGLKISSQLLALATIVHGTPESGKN